MKIVQGLEIEYQNYKELNSKDAYSNRIVSYGEDWANLMEPRIEKGEELKDIAKETSHEADTDGITGFMYGSAVSALSHFWIYGEQLRRWHNKEYGVSEETKGVVNPAILVVGE